MINSADPQCPGGCPGKRNLPFPYDQDLSQVLRHIKRRTPAGRVRLANDPLTASYLRAGKLLLDQHLGPEHQCACASQHDSRSLLGFLSQRNIVDAVQSIDDRAFPTKRLRQ